MILERKGGDVMKVKGCIRRTVAGLMIGLTLFSGYSASYMQASVCEASSAIPALYSLFYAILAGCGMSCGNTQQNSALCDAFCSWMDDVQAGREVVKEGLYGNGAMQQYSSLKGIAIGRKVAVSSFPKVVSLMRYFIKTVAPQYVSSGGKYTGSNIADYNQVTFHASSNTYAELLHVSNSFGCDLTSFSGTSFSLSKLKNSPMYAIGITKDLTYMFLYYYEGSVYPASNTIFCKSGDGGVPVLLRNYNTSFTNGNYQRFNYYRFSRASVTSNWKYLSSSSDTSNYIPIDDTSYDWYVGHTCKYFESYDELERYVGNMQRYKAIEGIYGYYTEYNYPSNYEITAGDSSISDAITKGISQALDKAGEQGLSADEVASIVQANVIDYTSEIEKINDSVNDLNSTQVVTNSWLSKIYSKICEMSATDGSSALDLDDVTEQFKVMEGGGQPDNDDNEPPKIWGVGAFTTIKLLEPVFKFFGEPLSLITKWLNSIQKTIESTSAKEVEQAVKNQQENSNAITNVIEVISDFPMKIYEQFKVVLGNIIIYLDNIATAAAAGAQVLTEFPLEIVQWISQGVSEALDLHPLEVSIPDVSVDVDFPPIEIPILSDILAVLEAILGAVRAFFIIDTAELEKAMDLNKGKIEKKLPFEPARELFAAFKFSDSYDYPILKIQSPGIIKQFTQEDYIILFDGKNFADYFKLVRGLLVATLWFGYAYCIVCKFRVRFTLD